MPKILTPDEITQFQEQGYAYPFRAFDAAQAAVYRDRIEAYEKFTGRDANQSLKIKGHLAFPWLMEIATNKQVLDAVEDVIGPNIMLFGSSIFAKDARNPSYVSWHQDSAYFGLTPHSEITAWVALTDATTEMGCLRVAPGSHRGPALQHAETFAKDNMLAKGQSLVGIDEDAAVAMPLSAGQFSIHHEQTAHSSLPNRSTERRVGFAFFFIPTHVRMIKRRGKATLVRGVDTFDHWDADTLPNFDLDPAAMAELTASWGTYKDGETKQVTDMEPN